MSRHHFMSEAETRTPSSCASSDVSPEPAARDEVKNGAKAVDDDNEIALFRLIARRANTLKTVAAYKYINGASLFDAQRERVLMQNNIKKATDNGLPVLRVLIFAQMQMDFSKHIEQSWVELWQTPGSTLTKEEVEQEVPPDLGAVRSEIMEIDKELYGVRLPAQAGPLNCDQFSAILREEAEVFGVRGVWGNLKFLVPPLCAALSLVREGPDQIPAVSAEPPALPEAKPEPMPPASCSSQLLGLLAERMRSGSPASYSADRELATLRERAEELEGQELPTIGPAEEKLHLALLCFANLQLAVARQLPVPAAPAGPNAEAAATRERQLAALDRGVFAEAAALARSGDEAQRSEALRALRDPNGFQQEEGGPDSGCAIFVSMLREALAEALAAGLKA